MIISIAYDEKIQLFFLSFFLFEMDKFWCCLQTNVSHCIEKYFNVSQVANDMREAVPEGKMDTVFRDMCIKWPKVYTPLLICFAFDFCKMAEIWIVL